MTINILKQKPEHLSHPKYRPDIDGLRAIAVLSVVGFHAFPFWIKGGFIGVDIFFVISGFLISTIIFDNLERNSFSFVEFYSRRIKRIFPALLLVLFACFAFGWFALLADEYKQLGKHIAAGAGFVSNFVFWNESGYFDNAAETKPLLHLWTLGIEEQFYIVWPLLLWAAWKRKFNLLTITIVIAAISFVLNVKGIHTDAVATFYSPQTRFWELLTGSILAFITLYKQNLFAQQKLTIDRWLGAIIYAHTSEANGNTLRNVQSLLGAVLISVGILIITKERHFPGTWALLPTLGAALIISAGSQAWLNRVVLSNRVLVWFGLISFPLYLWHWPILSFARILASETPSLGVRGGIVLLSITLAWLTYRFIELPVRFGLQKTHKRSIAQRSHKVLYLMFLAFIIGAIGYLTYKQDGYAFRMTIKEGALNERNYRHGGFFLSGAVNCSDVFKPLIKSTWCAKTNNDPIVAIIGDSHAGQLFLGISVSSDKKLKKAIFMGAGSCYPSVGKDSREGCGKQLQLAFDIIGNYKSIEYVIVAGNYQWVNEGDKSAADYMVGFRKTIDHFISMGKKVVFVIDNPALGFDPDLCLMENRPIMKLINKSSQCSSGYTSNLLDQSKYRAYINELVIAYPNVLFYDPQKKLFTNGLCKIFDNRMLLYSDYSHLSKYGSSYLTPDLFEQIKSKWDYK